MTYFYLKNFFQMLSDDELGDNMVENYHKIYRKNRDSSYGDVSKPILNIIEWYHEDPDTYSEQDVSDINPYYMMKVVLDEYGGQIFDGKNQQQIANMCRHHYVYEQIKEEAELLKEDIEEHLMDSSACTIQALARGVLTRRKVHFALLSADAYALERIM